MGIAHRCKQDEQHTFVTGRVSAHPATSVVQWVLLSIPSLPVGALATTVGGKEGLLGTLGVATSGRDDRNVQLKSRCACDAGADDDEGAAG